MLTYRSNGVHTNRKGGKTSRQARDRFGKTIQKKKPKKSAAASLADTLATNQRQARTVGNLVRAQQRRRF